MANKKRALQLLQKLVRTNSENPPGDQRKIAGIVRNEMALAGLDVKVYQFKKNMPCVVGTLRGCGKAKRKSLLLTPHMDTVPAGKGWKHDPFGAQIENGKMFGRGVQDCKMQVAACIEAARSLTESGTKLEGDLIIAAMPDEETGNQFGLEPLLKKGIIKPDYTVVVDGSAFEVKVTQKGLMHMTAEVFGKKSHGAYPWLGDNAINKAVKIILDLEKFKFIYKKHPLLHPPTISIGTIHAGDKVNIVPDRCKFEIDLRYLPGMDRHKIMRNLRKVFSKHAAKFKITVDDQQDAYEADLKHPAVSQLLGSLKKQSKRAALAGSEGAVSLCLFKKRNAVCTGFGPADVAHMNDEYIHVKDLADGTKALEDFVRKFLKEA